MGRRIGCRWGCAGGRELNADEGAEVSDVSEMTQADCDRIDVLLRDFRSGMRTASAPLARALGIDSEWVVEMVAISIHFMRMRAVAHDNREMITDFGQQIADAFVDSLERGPFGEAVRDMEALRAAAQRTAKEEPR